MDILIVEDNRHMRRILAHLLREAYPFACVADAGDGATAMRLCDAGPPELVLMDIGLPDVNGLELGARIKKRWPDTVIVVVSSHGSSTHRAHATACGACGFVTKDAIQDQLLPMLQRLFCAGPTL